jgi:hypothetical protein
MAAPVAGVISWRGELPANASTNLLAKRPNQTSLAGQLPSAIQVGQQNRIYGPSRRLQLIAISAQYLVVSIHSMSFSSDWVGVGELASARSVSAWHG